MPLEAPKVTAVRKMLASIGREGIRFYPNTPYRPWNNVAIYHKAITTSNELDALLPSHERMAGNLEGRAIPLAPGQMSNGAAALLRMEWDFNAEPYKLRYYLLLYYGARANSQPLLGLSFRLEQPEGAGQPSAHDYWHIQMCREVALDRATPVLGVHPHTPVKYPAFPLNASDAVSLTASIWVTLAGRAGLQSSVTALVGQGPLAQSLNERYAHALA